MVNDHSAIRVPQEVDGGPAPVQKPVDGQNHSQVARVLAQPHSLHGGRRVRIGYLVCLLGGGACSSISSEAWGMCMRCCGPSGALAGGDRFRTGVLNSLIELC